MVTTSNAQHCVIYFEIKDESSCFLHLTHKQYDVKYSDTYTLLVMFVQTLFDSN